MATIFPRRQLLGPHAEPPSVALSELFHENTKLHRGVPLASGMNDFGDAETEAMVSVGRRYARLPQVPLAPADAALTAGVSFAQAVRARRTIRSFAPAPVAFEALSELLRLANGITAEVTTPSGHVRHLRAAPSGGALYPVELYLGVKRVAGLVPGLYHFAPREEALGRLREGDPEPWLRRACHYHQSLSEAALVVMFAAVLPRTKRKYGERGYRYALIETGHVAQNLGLAAAALGLGCMNVCGFFDDELNDLLGLDGVDEVATYVAYLGPPGDPAASVPR